MASSEQIELSDFIKSVHLNLRKRSLEVGAEEAWKKHCSEQDVLQRYASAMKELATKHWDGNNKQSVKVISRIEWTNNTCNKYFITDKDYLKYRERELEIAKKIDLSLTDECVEMDIVKLKLLDVGSCYNPFKQFEQYNVVAIDLAPANSEVLQCDFLRVDLSEDSRITNSEVSSLKTSDFDVVIFSLLLEYLPSAEQRLTCCEKAYKLLKTEGILIIITPDSKHVGANAKIMKSWRYLLAKIGFSRIKYEKLPYMHCMEFRKSLNIDIASRWAKIYEKNDFYQTMVIPQDLNSSNKQNVVDVNKEDNK